MLLTSGSARAVFFDIPDGDVSQLISSIATANTNGQDDVIILAAGGTYELTAVYTATNGATGLPIVGSDSGHILFVNGNGATLRRSTAGGTPDFRIFQLGNGSNVVASGLVILNGNATGGSPADYGGAIYNDGGSLSLSNSTVKSNRAGWGGAIASQTLAGTANVTVSNIAMSDNDAALNGGGIYTRGNNGNAANLTVTNSTISGNGARNDGGGIYCDNSNGGNGLVAITHSSFAGNTAGHYGGGLVDFGLGGGSESMTLNDCSLSANTAHGLNNLSTGSGDAVGGGGLFNEAGVVILNRCTFAKNSAIGGDGGDNPGLNTTGGAGGRARGGGVYNELNSDLTANSCTFVQNVATGGAGGNGHTGGQGGGGEGGGIYSDGAIGVIACTLTANTGAGGPGGTGSTHANDGASGFGIGGLAYGASNIRNTISAGNIGNTARDAAGAFTSAGHNLIGSGDNSSGFTASGDQVGTNLMPKDPKFDLSGLQNNGGLTPTLALLANSPAINAGDDALPGPPVNLTVDQRGYPRKIGAHVDIGAFEFEFGGRLRVISVAPSNNHIVVTFQALQGASYRLELRISVGDDALPWGGISGVADISATTTGPAQITDTTNAIAPGKAFYRVHLLP